MDSIRCLVAAEEAAGFNPQCFPPLLEELHPRDYVVYAYAALTMVVELLLEREA